MKDITHSGIRFTLIGAALAVSLAASGGAQATEVIGAMGNDAGGEILLTNDKCGAKAKGRTTISTNADGRVTHFGCAHPLRPGRVIVQWTGSGTSILSMSHWTPNETDRSLKSFSDAELDRFFVRTAWFHDISQTAARILWEAVPDAAPVVPGTPGKFILLDDEPPAPTAMLAGPATTTSRRNQ
jgi:hypothetical protein